jgi:hypothetical protein
VEDQTAHVARLTQHGRDTTAAEHLLSSMRQVVLIMRVPLADEQESLASKQ